MKIPNVISSYQENPTVKKIQKHLYEAYQLSTCSVGPYPDPDDREAVWKAFNLLFYKLIKKRIK